MKSLFVIAVCITAAVAGFWCFSPTPYRASFVYTQLGSVDDEHGRYGLDNSRGWLHPHFWNTYVSQFLPKDGRSADIVRQSVKFTEGLVERGDDYYSTEVVVEIGAGNETEFDAFIQAMRRTIALSNEKSRKEELDLWKEQLKRQQDPKKIDEIKGHIAEARSRTNTLLVHLVRKPSQ